MRFDYSFLFHLFSIAIPATCSSSSSSSIRGSSSSSSWGQQGQQQQQQGSSSSSSSSSHPRCPPTIVTPLSTIIPPLQLLFNSIVLPGTTELPIHIHRLKQIESYIRRIGWTLEDEFNGVQRTLYHKHLFLFYGNDQKVQMHSHQKSTSATKLFSDFF